jgi:hypothetical protein
VKLLNDVTDFVERFASLLSVEGGMPRMPARVFACLLAADDGALTAAELASRLGVSPAAISGAVRYLVQVRLIMRVRKPGSRSDTYRLGEDLWSEVYSGRSGQFARYEQVLADGIAELGPGHPAAGRLAETREFFAFLRIEMPALMERWREHRKTLH